MTKLLFIKKLNYTPVTGQWLVYFNKNTYIPYISIYATILIATYLAFKNYCNFFILFLFAFYFPLIISPSVSLSLSPELLISILVLKASVIQYKTIIYFKETVTGI